MFMGFTLHFYIIFGTNLLTGGPARIAIFLPISVYRRKGISNGVKMEWNLQERSFWNKRNPGDFEWTSRSSRGGHEAGGDALGGGRPPPSWAPHGSPDRLPSPIYIYVPRKHPGAPRKLFPPLQTTVSARSHLGAFAGAPPEGESTMEGHYIISKASPMSCE